MRKAGGLPRIYLKPGEFHYSGAPAVLSTVLGSCVAITMHNPGSGVGAMCHVLLPRCRNGGECSLHCTETFRYLECTFFYMLRQFDSCGVSRREIDVKLFGGADMFETRKRAVDPKTVGRQNIELAHALMKQEGLRLKADDVGGALARKVFFFTGSGEVFVKKLPGMKDRKAGLP